MAESRDDTEVFWVDPVRRGIIPLDGFHVSRSLRRTLRQGRFQVTFNQAFAEVLAGCAGREATWISQSIAALYSELHAQGWAHSTEVWLDEELAGGIYGVALGAAFFGESMFSRRTDASKVALYHLIERLKARSFELFDTQFLTPHLASLGAVEISRAAYRKILFRAIECETSFH